MFPLLLTHIYPVVFKISSCLVCCDFLKWGIKFSSTLSWTAFVQIWGSWSWFHYNQWVVKQLAGISFNVVQLELGNSLISEMCLLNCNILISVRKFGISQKDHSMSPVGNYSLLRAYIFKLPSLPLSYSIILCKQLIAMQFNSCLWTYKLILFFGDFIHSLI